MFILSQSSLNTMKGVNPKLVAVVKRAIQITPIDFKVGEGLRTLERQKELLAEGKTRTLRSKHLTGKAVDLWALTNGVVDWRIRLYYILAQTMQKSAQELSTPIIWGGIWDKPLTSLSGDLRAEYKAYKKRFLAKHPNRKNTFFDGPHFEIVD